MAQYRVPYLDGANKVPTARLGGAGAGASNYLCGDQTWKQPTAAPGDTATIVLAGATTTVLANTCRYIVGQFEIAATAVLEIALGGALEIG